MACFPAIQASLGRSHFRLPLRRVKYWELSTACLKFWQFLIFLSSHLRCGWLVSFCLHGTLHTACSHLWAVAQHCSVQACLLGLDLAGSRVWRGYKAGERAVSDSGGGNLGAMHLHATCSLRWEALQRCEHGRPDSPCVPLPGVPWLQILSDSREWGWGLLFTPSSPLSRGERRLPSGTKRHASVSCCFLTISRSTLPHVSWLVPCHRSPCSNMPPAWPPCPSHLRNPSSTDHTTDFPRCYF